MLTPLIAAVALGGLAQSNDQSYLGIFAETKIMRIAGLEMPEMPDLPPGMELPNMPGMGAFPGKPSRSLQVRLWSPSIAPAGATASLAPPAGLKQGNKLDLELYRPKAGQVGEEGGASDPGKIPEFTIKIYWGSSEKVRDGQPKIIRFGDLTPEQKAAMREQAAKSNPNARDSYFYKEGWTTGYWPTKKQPGRIAKDASLVGMYRLTSSYTGNVELEAPSQVDFLDPIDVTSPDLSKQLKFDSFLPFQWKQIPNALGLHAMITGMQGKNTMILWYSSEVFTEGLGGTNWDYMQMADVRENVAKKVFMPGDATKATVPAGIFKDADFVMMQMIGYGPGAALAQGQPLPRIQTKTTFMGMLGGKEMRMD